MNVIVSNTESLMNVIVSNTESLMNVIVSNTESLMNVMKVELLYLLDLMPLLLYIVVCMPRLPGPALNRESHDSNCACPAIVLILFFLKDAL